MTSDSKIEYCIKCGHVKAFVNPITLLCDSCEAQIDWEDNHACKRCYVNERDPRSAQQLCLTCENSLNGFKKENT